MRINQAVGAGLAALLAFASASFAQDTASQKFLKEAIEGNLAEVQMGQLAQKNGNNDGVRSFGQLLEKDHSEANQKATAAASSLGVTPPTAPNSKQKAAYDRMSKLSGTKFDREFVKHMVEDHKKDIKDLRKGVEARRRSGHLRQGSPADIAYASRHRAVLERREHDQTALR